MNFGAWVLKTVSGELTPLKKPVPDSRLAPCPLRTFIVLQRFSQMCIEVYTFPLISLAFQTKYRISWIWGLGA